MPRAMSKTEIIVQVRGGCVQAVHSTNPDTRVEVLDWDSLRCEEPPGAKRRAEALVHKTRNMHGVL